MAYDYDLAVVGLGPAGMAVSIMGAEMGLRVCAIEKHRVGGECMNVGCIPSKALLRMAKVRHTFARLADYELSGSSLPKVESPFRRIQEHLDFISEKKTMGMFHRVEMIYQQGPARFHDPHTLAVGERTVSARRIFLCVGTRPALPAIPGLDTIEPLTNENLFSLAAVPESLVVIGGGAIACEMAQAFARLGSTVTMVVRGRGLIWREYARATEVLEAALAADGVTLLRTETPAAIEKTPKGLALTTDKGSRIEAARLLVAAGRRYDFDPLGLEGVGVTLAASGAIQVNKHLQTTQPHIYACGDCNGYHQFSHAAMHQGMIALMNSMAFWPFKQDFRTFAVPWTIFTEPQVSHVGPRETALQERGVRYEPVEVQYGDYGAAIAEGVDTGFVRALVSPTGKIRAATIVGEGSGEMINEWALAVQKGVRMHEIVMLQHSFPTMGFLSKRTGETWMMGKMQSERLRGLCRWLFRL